MTDYTDEEIRSKALKARLMRVRDELEDIMELL